jgi:hypothetical protein
MSDEKGFKLERPGFTIEVKYSPEAIEKKLLRFTTKNGDSFEISAEELASTLIGQVNSDLVEATFVESDRVNVVDVTRQIRAIASRDIKKGEEIRIDYTHPYPVEFAIIEEAANVAKIRMDTPRYELTVDYINAVKEKITPKQRRFVDLIYKFFKDLKQKASPSS